VIERLAQCSRRRGQASFSSRPSNSWLPATSRTGWGQSANAVETGPGAVDVAGEDQQLGPGAGCGS
jgi:hypothetical protein